MKVYAIAETKNECHGHGDYEDVASINNDCGPWPVFFTRELAEDVLVTDLFSHRKEIVEIEVFTQAAKYMDARPEWLKLCHRKCGVQ